MIIGHPRAKRAPAEVSIGLSGDKLTPQRITDKLKIVPSRAWAKGDEYQSRSGRTLKKFQGIWAVTCTADSVASAAKALFDLVLPVEAAFVAVAATEGAIRSLSIWWEPDGGQGGFSVDTRLLAPLIRLVDRVDVYFPGEVDKGERDDLDTDQTH